MISPQNSLLWRPHRLILASVFAVFVPGGRVIMQVLRVRPKARGGHFVRGFWLS